MLVQTIPEACEEVPGGVYNGTYVVEASNHCLQVTFGATPVEEGFVNVAGPVSSFAFSEVDSE